MASKNQRLAPILAALLFGASTHRAAGQDSQATSKAESSGVVFVLGGIGGIDPLPLSAHLVLPRAGVPHEIRNFVWTHGWRQLLKDLKDLDHAKRKAQELADEIQRVKDQSPERPIYVLAKSGGAGVALMAAEKLPQHTFERIVLLNAAVSRSYDLRPALRATKRQIISFHSRGDQIVLNMGTRTFGTIDRVRGPGAGLRGFERPADLSEDDEALYGRLIQFSWEPSMLLQGYAGMHTGTSMPLFLSRHAAPWLR